jgi:surface protein
MKNLNVIQVKSYGSSILEKGKMFILGIAFFAIQLAYAQASPPAGAFVTVWDTDGTTSIRFEMGNNNVSTPYYWEEVGNVTNNGSGNFAGKTGSDWFTVSSLPNGANAKIRLFLGPQIKQFKVFENQHRFLEVSSWGEAQWGATGLAGAFNSCEVMDVTATDAPDLTEVTSLLGLFTNCLKLEGNSIGTWDVSNVQNMTSVFHNCRKFNADISSWNTSKATSMFRMFYNAWLFNKDISNWSVNNVANMNQMFEDARAFNQDLSSWCVPLIETLPSDFYKNTYAWTTTNRIPLWGACRVWNGSVSSDFSDVDNWEDVSSSTKKPDNSTVKIVSFKSNATNDLVLDGNLIADAIHFGNSNAKIVMGNHNITTKVVKNANSKLRFRTNGTGQLVTDISNGSTFTFHVGNTTYNPLVITNNTGTTDEFRVRVVNGVYYKGTTGKSLGSEMNRVDRVWVINKGNGTANAGSGVNLQFSWPTTDEVSPTHTSGNGFDVVAMNKYNPTIESWQTVAGGTYNAGEQTFTFSSYMGTFSNFAMGGSANALPVNFTSFTAEAMTPSMANIKWSTSFEENTSHYEIQRSTDGVQWMSIGQTDAAGFSHETSNYTFVDFTPEAVNYYRLKQVDVDGTVDYSAIRLLVFRSAESAPSTVNVYPNPSRGLVHLQTSDQSIRDFKLFNIQGQLIQEGKIAGKTSLQNLPVGVYKLVTFDQLSTETASILIQ